jgi:hypothetical protein
MNSSNSPNLTNNCFPKTYIKHKAGLVDNSISNLIFMNNQEESVNNNYDTLNNTVQVSIVLT